MDLLPKLADLGLMGIQFPEEYGGAAMSASTTASASRSWRASDPAVALSVAAHNGLCTSHIAMFGTEAQKQTIPAAAGPRARCSAPGG
jgi:alkylation response protein AidB-like acyl-CoA dehydrogenase